MPPLAGHVCQAVPPRCVPMEQFFTPLALPPRLHARLEQGRACSPPSGHGPWGEGHPLRLPRLASPCGRRTVERLVQHDCRPHRPPYGPVRQKPPGRWSRDAPWGMPTAPPLVGARTVETTDMRLAGDVKDRGGFGARPGPAGCPPAWAAWLRRAQGADCIDDGECGTSPAAVPRPAGLVSTLPRARGGGRARLVETRRLFAWRPVQTLGKVTERGVMGFAGCLQRGFPLCHWRVLRPPVVRLPGALPIGLFRQHHGLWAERRCTFPLDCCERRGGEDV